jgi:hypothetical protein
MNVTTKQPSSELLSLIKAAAQSLLGFGELWGSIKAKGKDEGFSELDLQDMLRPLLRDRLGMNKDKIYYLFHKEEVKARATERYEKMANAYRKKTTFDVEKEPEQSDIHILRGKELSKEIDEIAKIEGIDLSLADMNKTKEILKDVSLNEEPTEVELLRIENAQLKDALHKTEQFKPATQLAPPREEPLTDEIVFQWLRNRAQQSGDIIVIDRVGSGALVQALAQYKNSFGVAELFLRVIKK